MKKGYKKPVIESIEMEKEICGTLTVSGTDGDINGQTNIWDKTH